MDSDVHNLDVPASFISPKQPQTLRLLYFTLCAANNIYSSYYTMGWHYPLHETAGCLWPQHEQGTKNSEQTLIK